LAQSPLIVCRFSGRGTPSFRSLAFPLMPKSNAETTEMITFAFLIFRNASKYACQAQKPPKHIKKEGIELAF
jgi:hypothetical protein